MLEAGFDTFIDLTEAGEFPPYDIYLPGSVRYVRKPIPDHGVPRAREHMAEIQAVIDAALAGAGASTCTAAPASGAPALRSPVI